MPWIKKQQAKFHKQERQTKREYVSGESHYFMGKRYLLNVRYTNSKPKVEIKRKSHINMYLRPNTNHKNREKVMNNFYRLQLKQHIPSLVKKWTKIIGVNVQEVKIKKMKTKWGSCNPKHQRVWLNLELAKKPVHSIEYVFVHEMTHFLEKHHTEKFKLLMTSFMPQWTQYRDELNSSKLGYSKWNHNLGNNPTSL